MRLLAVLLLSVVVVVTHAHGWDGRRRPIRERVIQLEGRADAMEASVENLPQVLCNCSDMQIRLDAVEAVLRESFLLHLLLHLLVL